MLPFTVEDVVNAYKAHPEIEPCQNRYVRVGGQGGIIQACGLSVILIAAGKEDVARRLENQDTRRLSAREAAEAMEWDMSEETINSIDSFMTGFDGGDVIDCGCKRCVEDRGKFVNEAVNIGIQCYEAAIGLR